MALLAPAPLSLNHIVGFHLDNVPKVVREMSAASTAMAVTSVAFNPLDVMKTKIQTQGQLANGTDVSLTLYKNVRHCGRTLLAEQGFVRGLWLPGLTASVARDVINGGIRIGLYPTFVTGINDACSGCCVSIPSLGIKLLAGWCTGMVGAIAGNPTDLIKIRLQAESGCIERGVYTTGLYKGVVPSYRSAFHACTQILNTEGIQGLFRGCTANIARAALVTSGQMASYDETKVCLTKLAHTCGIGFLGDESIKVPIASAVSGVVAATMAAPADLVRSRVMDACRAGEGRDRYYGAIDCVVKTIRYEGVFALWRGWVPAYMRLGPQFIVAFPLMELLRIQVFGLKPFGA